MFGVESREQGLFPCPDPLPSLLPPSLLCLVLSLPPSVLGIPGKRIPALIRKTDRKSHGRDVDIFIVFVEVSSPIVVLPWVLWGHLRLGSIHVLEYLRAQLNKHLLGTCALC